MEFIMANLPAIIWFGVAIIFLVIELVTVATVSIWAVAGCIVACLIACVGAPVWLQLIVAVVVTGGLFGATYKKIRADKNDPKKLLQENISEGVEGKVGTVTSIIEPGERGQVLVDGIQWSAKCINEDERIEEKAHVIICRLDGTCCIVDRYELQ